MVRWPAKRRASALSVAAGTSQIRAAHSALFGTPSMAPVRYGRNLSKPTVYLARNVSSCSFST